MRLPLGFEHLKKIILQRAVTGLNKPESVRINRATSKNVHFSAVSAGNVLNVRFQKW